MIPNFVLLKLLLMPRMYKILKFRIIILVIIIISFKSCRKENVKDDENVNIVNYEIELDNTRRLLKITQSNPPDVFIRSYVYDNKEVEVVFTYNGTVQITEKYFLNESGLADSSVTNVFVVPVPPSVTHYKYNNENYLINSSAGWLSFNYLDGNRISAIDGSYGPYSFVGTYYDYSLLLNIIDIEEFTGSYHGNLNKNLIIKKTYRGFQAIDGKSTDYEYVLDANGLVIQRTTITTYTKDPNNIFRDITNFKYIFVDTASE